MPTQKKAESGCGAVGLLLETMRNPQNRIRALA